MKKEYLGIDLGSSNTIVYSSSTDSVLFREPTAIAYDSYSHEVREIGFLAETIQGKTPYSYEVINPVERGNIADDDAAYDFLSQILISLKLEKRFRTVSLIFACPTRCSKVNRKALIEIGKKMNAKEIFLESQAKLAALGAGDNVFAPTATLICQIGAGISDIALLSMGEVVSGTTCYVSGTEFDEAIRRYMIQKQHLSIGMKSAEYLKKRGGNLFSASESRLTEIKGKDTITSLPSSMVVSSSEIRSVLVPLADILAMKITDVIASAPTELVSDLYKNGMILSGGGALLGGIKEYLQNRLSLPVRIAEKPLESVSLGFSRYVERLNKGGKR